MHRSIQPSLFSKKPLLNISQLKRFYDNSSLHLVKDKLSEKMGRRDIQFYDLYKHRKQEDVDAVNSKDFPIEGVLACGANRVNEENKDEQDEDAIYGDIEVDDFNKLYHNNNLITDQFGQSISITVNFNKKKGKMNRKVKEDLTKVTVQTDSLDKTGGNRSSQAGKSSGTSFDKDEEDDRHAVQVLNQ